MKKVMIAVIVLFASSYAKAGDGLKTEIKQTRDSKKQFEGDMRKRQNQMTPHGKNYGSTDGYGTAGNYGTVDGYGTTGNYGSSDGYGAISSK